MNYALITGASSGLGKEFARQLSKEYKLILVARNKALLEQLKRELDTECIVICMDLSSEQNCYELVKICQSYTIDLCINNAGSGKVNDFMNITLQEDMDMIHLNICASHILTKAMILQGCKNILNVTSSAGLLPAGPYMATYYATKSYMTSLTRAIASEHKDIYLALLCPGPVKSNFDLNAGVHHSLNGISTQSCVSYTLKQMKKHKKVIIPTTSMKLAIGMGSLIPQSLLIEITKKQQLKKLK